MSRVVGYYQSWKRYSSCKERDLDAKIQEKSNFYTHLIYAFAGLDGNRLKVNDQWGDVDQDGYRKFNKLKRHNSNLKTLLAVGGWIDGNKGAKPFSDMVQTAASRKEFIKSCLEYVERYGFDGIDLDWEYPADIERGGRKEDKKNFTLLVQEMSAVFHQRGYLLSAAVAAGEASMRRSYEVPEISKHLDFINLMTYDLHSAADNTGRVGHNAPLYSPDGQDVSSCLNAWIRADADPKKLNLGIPAYGRSYALASDRGNSIGCSCAGAGSPESLDYTEILKMIESGLWTVKWDDAQKVPYMYRGKEWIGFDDGRSVAEKVVFAKRCGVGGYMLWAIDSDNPLGTGSSAFPLTFCIRINM